MTLPSYCIDPDAVLKDHLNEIQWRSIRPDYSKANSLFHKCKRTNHPKDSVEYLVQSLVKNWEKEASHKVNVHQWVTIDPDNYRFSCNGQEKYTAEEMIEQGTYNALIGQTHFYDSKNISFEESHQIFKKCLSDGFAWEVLEVYSGAPNVTFTWRHFGPMKSGLTCRALSGLIYHSDATNQMIEIFGMCKATVNDKFQIGDLQVFYDPSQLFVQLTQINPFAPFQTLTPSKTKSPLNHSSNQQQISSSTKKEEQSLKQSSTPISSKLCLLS